MEPLFYSWLVRSLGDNLGLELAPEVGAVLQDGDFILWVLMPLRYIVSELN